MSTLEMLEQRKAQLEKQIGEAKRNNRDGLANTFTLSLNYVKEMETTLRMVDRILAKHQGKKYNVGA